MLSGDASTSRTIKSQVSDHKKVAELMQKEIDNGKDAQAKAFATETLPEDQRAHLKHAQDIEASLEGSAKNNGVSNNH